MKRKYLKRQFFGYFSYRLASDERNIFCYLLTNTPVEERISKRKKLRQVTSNVKRTAHQTMLREAGSSDDMPEYAYTAHEDIDLRRRSFSMSNDDENTNTYQVETDNSNKKEDFDSWQRNYTLSLYAITSVLLFADQNLLAPNLSQAATEFGFNDDEKDK